MGDSSVDHERSGASLHLVKQLPEPARESLRILILEDVSADAELIEVELRRAQMAFASRRVESEEEFVRALSDFGPDLILADYSLPQFNALDALRLLRARHVGVPFILVTGTQTEQIAVECMREGADDYILNPCIARQVSRR